MIAQEARKKEPDLSHSPKAKIEKSAVEDSTGGTSDPAEVAEYLADLLEGAKTMATDNGMVFLAYLIQVAVEEARIQAAAPKDSHY